MIKSFSLMFNAQQRAIEKFLTLEDGRKEVPIEKD
jgi:hypothetical protein